MHRRNFLASLTAALPAAALAHASEAQAPFNAQTPAQFKAHWRGGAFLFRPDGSTLPFLAWYPGDTTVSAWALDLSTLRTTQDPTVRSFLHEAARRGYRVEIFNA